MKIGEFVYAAGMAVTLILTEEAFGEEYLLGGAIVYTILFVAIGLRLVK